MKIRIERTLVSAIQHETGWAEPDIINKIVNEVGAIEKRMVAAGKDMKNDGSSWARTLKGSRFVLYIKQDYHYGISVKESKPAWTEINDTEKWKTDYEFENAVLVE